MLGRRQSAPFLGVVAGALAAGFALASAPAGAQEATPGVLGDEPYPSAIHTGTCDALGDVAFDLSDIGEAAAQGATPPAGEPGVLAVGLTPIEASLEDFLAAEHAVVVLQGEDAVACGNIEGTGDPQQGRTYGGQVLAVLDERNGSGLRGQAILTELGPGSTNVTVMLAEADSAVLATPEATPEE